MTAPLTGDEIELLMARKLQQAHHKHSVTTQIMDLLGRAYRNLDLDQEDHRCWVVSIYNPLKRRHQEAAQACVFWADREQVEQWIAHRQGVKAQIDAWKEKQHDPA